MMNMINTIFIGTIIYLFSESNNKLLIITGKYYNVYVTVFENKFRAIPISTSLITLQNNFVTSIKAITNHHIISPNNRFLLTLI